MSSNQQQISREALDDLCSRFIINIPSDQRDDPVRILFVIELAHWFYIDVYCEDDTNLYQCNIKEFAEQIFQHCPFLRDYISDLDSLLSQWRGFKYSVPTYGAILLDPTYEYVLLVQGFCQRENWGFPKGKIQENENPLKCAIREVFEEVGFDIKERAFEEQYLEREVNGQIVRLYIVEQVSMQTKFIAKMKNEIKEMRWFPIADLPNHRRDITPQSKLNINAKSFFMVIPFIKDLRRWINQEYRTSSFRDHKTKKFQAQNTTQRRFSQILKNDSVIDNTSITDTLHLTSTKPNDDENQRLLSMKKPPRKQTDPQEPLSSLTNDIFRFNGPRCWTEFRLNRSEIFRCLHE